MKALLPIMKNIPSLCVFKDDVPAIMDSVLNADVVCWATAAENEEFVPKRAEGGLTGWIDCYGKSELKGHIFCGGVGAPNEIASNTKLQEAFEMGKTFK